MQEQTKKRLFWITVTALFIYAFALPFVFPDEENGSWYEPLVWVLPAIGVTLLLKLIAMPPLEIEHLDDSKVKDTVGAINTIQNAR